MNPSDANSSLATLRQLKEMLDAGTLTPQEFEALKQKLVFGQATAAEATVPAAEQSAFVPPVAVSEALTSAPALPGEESIPLPLPAERPEWLRADPAASEYSPTPAAGYTDTDSSEGLDNQRNPLNLVFAIGGALVFLAVVLYLTLGNRGPDEHLTSTSQTAADSTVVAPETGPQAQQLTLPPATPETVRVAPVAPAIAPTAPRPGTDSTAATAPVAAPTTTTPAKQPAAKPAPAPATTPVAADTAI